MRRLLFILILLPYILLSQWYEKDVTPKAYTIYSGAHQNYIIEANNAWYVVYSDAASNDLCYIKSTDHGETWGSPVEIIDAISALSIAVNYDGWCRKTGGLIHTAVLETGGEIVYYRTINTASGDALGTQRTAYDSTQNVTSGASLSLGLTPAGYLMVSGKISTTANSFCRISTDNGVNWSSTALIHENTASDLAWIFPGFAADTNDLLIIYYDASDSEISKKIYDWSAGSISEVSIATSINANTLGNVGGATLITGCYRNDTAVFLTYWDDYNSSGGDLKTWQITNTKNTNKTDVISNVPTGTTLTVYPGNPVTYSTVNSTYYVFWMGDGVDEQGFVYGSVYYRTSSDAGVTWSSTESMGVYMSGKFQLLPLYETTGTFATFGTMSWGSLTMYMKRNIKKINGVSPW